MLASDKVSKITFRNLKLKCNVGNKKT